MSDHPLTVIQFSDTHLEAENSEQMARLGQLRAQIESLQPDCVVLTGDVTADGSVHDGRFEGIKAKLDDWAVPVHVIPGNHDVGEQPGAADALTAATLERWKRVFGDDRFAVDGDDRWRLIGINSQLVGSGLAEEQDQIAWLDTTLDDAERRDQLVAVFTHTAFYLFEPDETLSGRGVDWHLEHGARQELQRRLDRGHVRLIANGHVHWHQVFDERPTKRVWCPATEMMFDDALFPPGGGVTGFVRYLFDRHDVEPQLVRTEGPERVVRLHRPTVALPGRDPITMGHLVLDFTGTLSKDGQLLPGVAERLTSISRRIRITVLTADTFGTARNELADLPVEVDLIETGADKQSRVRQLGADEVVAIGNGRNDTAMVKSAAIGIAVVGPEGAAGELLQAADVVVNDILDALDLVANPMRLKATLRQ